MLVTGIQQPCVRTAENGASSATHLHWAATRVRAADAVRLESCDGHRNGSGGCLGLVAAARADLLHHHMALLAEREPERLSFDGHQPIRILDDLAIDANAAAGDGPPRLALG